MRRLIAKHLRDVLEAAAVLAKAVASRVTRNHGAIQPADGQGIKPTLLHSAADRDPIKRHVAYEHADIP